MRFAHTLHRISDQTYRNIVFVTAFMLFCGVMVNIVVTTGSRNAATQAAKQAADAALSAKESQEAADARAARQRAQVIRLVRTIEDCTNPEGECAQRGQAQTGEAVGQINTVTIAAAWCRPTVSTYQELLGCVKSVTATG